MTSKQTWATIAILMVWVLIQAGNLYMRVKEHDLETFKEFRNRTSNSGYCPDESCG